MIKIGHVDLDTSHPGAWVPIEKELGYEVVGVFESNRIHPDGHAEQFVEKHSIPKIYDSLDQMADDVDVAIINGCNWDRHIELAEPFIRKNRGVLLDKPMVGNFKDANKLLEWARLGHRVTGGSSLRFAEEVKQFHKIPKEEFGEIQFILAGCANDEFNYAIHAYSLLHGLMGPGVESVKHLGAKMQHLIEVAWKDGRKGLLSVGKTEGYLPFYATIVGTKKVSHLQVDSSKIYRALLENVVPYLGGQTDTPPIEMEKLIEVELSAIAAKASWEYDNKRLFLSDLRLEDKGYDGYAFEEYYRQVRAAARKNS